MTPVLNRAPTMMNRPTMNSRVSHSTFDKYSDCSSARGQDENAGAQQCDQGRRDVDSRGDDEPGQHQQHDNATPDEQATISDGVTLLQRHDVGDFVGTDG